MTPVAEVAPRHALGAGDCEAWRDGPVGQPTNTLTSLGLVVAGAWVVARATTRFSSAHLPRWSEEASSAPPGPVQGGVPAFVRRWWPAGYGVLLSAAGIGSVAYHGRGGRASVWLHDGSLYALVAATAAAEARVLATRPRPLAPGALVGLVAASLAYLLGRTSSPACRPRSRWQWHGLWHLLVAMTGAAWAEDRLLRLDPGAPPARP